MARRQLTRLLFESPSVAIGEERELQGDYLEFMRRLDEGATGVVG
jgi:hypothetical protein